MANELPFILTPSHPHTFAFHTCTCRPYCSENTLQSKKHIRQFQHLAFMSCSCSQTTVQIVTVCIYLPVIRRTSSESSIANSTTASSPVFLFSISSSSWKPQINSPVSQLSSLDWAACPLYKLATWYKICYNVHCAVHLVSAKPEFITCNLWLYNIEIAMI